MTDVSTEGLDRVSLILPQGADLHSVLNAKALVPFDPLVVSFVESLGKSLLSNAGAREFPELVALGYWARRSNIARLKQSFEATYPDLVRLPRGVVFHVAPSNVDTIFVYSLLLSMLAGNVNVVRLSSRSGERSNILIDLLDRAFADGCPDIRQRTCIVRYEHDKGITDRLSQRADVRIVWGGDATTDLIRKSALSPHGTELVFPNRYSLAVIDADYWNGADAQAAIARNFVSDALWFGQMACSSPRALVWRGSEEAVRMASSSFWPAIERAARAANFPWEDATAVGKLVAEQDAAVEGATVLPLELNYVRAVRCPIEQLGRHNSANGGFFREFSVLSLSNIIDHAGPNWQTISSCGVGRCEWIDTLRNERPRGVSRIVPIGSALNFDAIWDGQDFLNSLTRMVQVGMVN